MSIRTSIPLFLLTLLILTACQMPPITDRENSPYYEIPTGSTLTLNQPITIPEGLASMYMQDGVIKPLELIDEYYPHCIFEVNNITVEKQTIEPDTFTIYRMELDEEVVSIQPYPIAGLRKVSGISYFEYITTLYLKSDKQPNVLRLTCLHREDLSDNLQHLTVSQIRKVIKGIFSLRLNTLQAI